VQDSVTAVNISDKAVKGLWNHALGPAALQKTAEERRRERKKTEETKRLVKYHPDLDVGMKEICNEHVPKDSWKH